MSKSKDSKAYKKIFPQNKQVNDLTLVCYHCESSRFNRQNFPLTVSVFSSEKGARFPTAQDG